MLNMRIDPQAEGMAEDKTLVRVQLLYESIDPQRSGMADANIQSKEWGCMFSGAIKINKNN